MRWLNKLSRQFLEKDYLVEGDSPEGRISVICDTAEEILGVRGLGQKLYNNVEKGWYSFSTPVWANFGTDRGLPISCYGSHVSDSMDSILFTLAETGMMTKYGGGTAAYWGDVRGRGSDIKNNGKSSGSVHFISGFDSWINLVSQGSTRRGNWSAYQRIDHPDIDEFLTIRTEGSPIQDISFAVCVPDYWMKAMIEGDAAKRKVWAKVIESRFNTGFPYIIFTDNANVGFYKEVGLRINHSQLCTEIFLPTSEEESFVCCLASMNALYFEEWEQDPEAVKILVYLLDAVMSEFIRKAKDLPFMERAWRFAERHRALGLGWLGWHSFLQSKGIPFESMEAKNWNVRVAKNIQRASHAASRELAGLYGEPEVCKGYGKRHSVLNAIAPTKSSSFILEQVSECIQPDLANVVIKDLAKGKFTVRNRYLEKVLEKYGKNDEPTWSSVLKNQGSVQHLDFLSPREKETFKTFREISPMEVVVQAAQRQPYIDQGQSLNLVIDPRTPAREVNALLVEGWKLGLKSFYYQIGTNAAQQLSRGILSCSSCES